MTFDDLRAAHDARDLNHTLFERSPAGMIITSLCGVIERINPAAQQLTAYPEAECLGSTPRLWQSGRQDPAFYAQMWRTMLHAPHWQGLLWNKRKDGALFLEELSVTRLSRASDGGGHMLGIMQEIDPLPLTQRDPLTGLVLAHAFIAATDRALAEARSGGTQVAVLFIDLDEFKSINDSLGHAAGDAVLVATAQRILRCARPHDTVARMGGDEFAVLMSRVAPSYTPLMYRARLIEAMRSPLRLGHTELTASLSVGVAIGPRGGEPATLLISRADASMYCRKRMRRRTPLD
jgi:diguanylate cyclase (GGDEF)-like protein/PAS domain S-box-containing protein